MDLSLSLLTVQSIGRPLTVKTCPYYNLQNYIIEPLCLLPIFNSNTALLAPKNMLSQKYHIQYHLVEVAL